MRYLVLLAFAAIAGCAATPTPPTCQERIDECKLNCAPRHEPTGENRGAVLGTSNTGPKSTQSCDQVCQNLCFDTRVDDHAQAKAD
jgi:hypothetical protein